METEIVQQPNGTVVKIGTEETVLETYVPEDGADIEREIAEIAAAITDLDNFRARRLQNLLDRRAELVTVRDMLRKTS